MEFAAFVIIIGVIGVMMTLMGLILFAKDRNTTKNMILIGNAILEYRVCTRVPLVDYKDMRPYDEVFFRFFDWGYKNILPPDKFELIKPYIAEAKKNENYM